MIHDPHARSAAKTEAQAQIDAAAGELARGSGYRNWRITCTPATSAIGYPLADSRTSAPGSNTCPSGREATLLRRLLRDVVEPRGRVIVGPIAVTELAATVAAFAAADVPLPGTGAAMDRAGKTRYVVWGSHA